MTRWSKSRDLFQNYVEGSARAGDYELEVVPWCLYDTVIIRDGMNTESGDRLNLFVQSFESEIRSNQWIAGMLPNPMAMLIEEIKIFGIATDTAFLHFRFEIGNKIMVSRPVWTIGVRGMKCRPAMMIPPLCNFRGRFMWEGAIRLGNGLTGRTQHARAIQIALIGQVARASQ